MNDRARSDPPDYVLASPITRREFILRTAAISAGLALTNVIPRGPGATPTGDPRLKDDEVKKWFLSPGGGRITKGNQVKTYIDTREGQKPFSDMVADIRRASGPEPHLVYLLGWYTDIDMELIPGDATTTLRKLLQKASDDDVQVRGMFWDRVGWDINNTATDFINGLKKGGCAAVHDNRTLNLGSHHQKVLIVNGRDGLVAYCGGLDFNPDRFRGKAAIGYPMHDTHVRITGPAAFDLLQVFNERWRDHPEAHHRPARSEHHEHAAGKLPEEDLDRGSEGGSRGKQGDGLPSRAGEGGRRVRALQNLGIR